jgi:hypothetical protein
VRLWFGLAALFLAAPPTLGDEPVLIDLRALNQGIGLDYESVVSYDELIEDALSRRLVLFGSVHDQQSAPRQLQRLVRALRERSAMPVRIGVEFVDRDDADILEDYLAGRLDEAGFLQRLFPTSLLLSPQVGRAHLDILRFARAESLHVLALESRPGGSRPRSLRQSEIRWNLAVHLARHPHERLVVLYGVDHILGQDPLEDGLGVPALVITSYADSIQAAFRRRFGRYPRPGEVLRLRPGVYLDAGEVPREPRLIRIELQGRDQLLAAIEDVYLGGRGGMDHIVAALGDEHPRWRRAAFHALRFASSEDFGYDPEAAPEVRRSAQARFRAWWEQTGRKPTLAP